MLSSKIFSLEFIRFVQGGLFLDFFLKKVGTIVVRCWLVYSCFFFGEKYIIEHITKKSVESFFWFFNTIFSVRNLSIVYFFLQIGYIIVFFFIISNIIFFVII